MNGNVTRDVVNDLWPLCEGGDASADSRRLVEEFLTQDRTFADELRRSATLPGAMPVIGEYIIILMRGGPSVTQITLTRFFAIHVVILPLIIGFFLVGHFLMIRKQGISGPL